MQFAEVHSAKCAQARSRCRVAVFHSDGFQSKNFLIPVLAASVVTGVSAHADDSSREEFDRSFLVRNIFTDFKRHDLGPNFHERNYDGTLQREFLTTPLWGVGSTAPYGHDGRSINLAEVIIRHGGEAQREGSTFDNFNDTDRNAVLAFLNSLVIFLPDDTSSNLNPGNRNDPCYPQTGHGSIRLTGLFNDPNDPE